MRRFSTQEHLPIGYSQQLLLDDDGGLVISCDSIFPTKRFQSVSFLEISPFIESIYPVLKALSIQDTALHFPKVETDLDFLPGTYDYYFSRVKLEEGEYILWSIYDYTKVYEDFRRFQQRRNELQVHRQLLEFRLQEFKRQEDLFQLSLAIRDTAVPKIGSIKQLEGPLSSPFNILDSFSWLLVQADLSAQNYVQTLEELLQRLLESIGYLSASSNLDDWSDLEASYDQKEAEDGYFQFVIPAEIKAIPLSRFPYLGVVLNSLYAAFAVTGMQTQVEAGLETATQGFEKGNIRLDVKVIEAKVPQLVKDFQKSTLQVYLLRNLVHQAGGQLTLRSSEEKKQIEFYILLPVKSASPS